MERFGQRWLQTELFLAVSVVLLQLLFFFALWFWSPRSPSPYQSPSSWLGLGRWRFNLVVIIIIIIVMEAVRCVVVAKFCIVTDDEIVKGIVSAVFRLFLLFLFIRLFNFRRRLSVF